MKNPVKLINRAMHRRFLHGSAWYENSFDTKNECNRDEITINIYNSNRDLQQKSTFVSIPNGLINTPEDYDVTNKFVNSLSFWITQSGKMRCGKRFVSESVRFAEAVHNGDFTDDWDAWILSIVEEEFSKST